MDPPQWLADRGGDGVDINVGCLEHLADAYRSHAVAMLEPPVALAFVADDDLLRYPVDVAERHRGYWLEAGEAQARIEAGVADSVQGEFQHRFVAEPVGPHERVHRHALLCEPACVLECRCRGGDIRDRDLIPQRV